MSLQFARRALTFQLNSGDAFKLTEFRTTLRMMNTWWTEYKQWEERDTFDAAFRGGRMTVRQGTESQTYGDYNGQVADIAFSARHGDVEKRLYPAERYRTGTDSLKERLNPENFGMHEGERLKYRHGLHDLSGSLCSPMVPLITKQVRWKWGELAKRTTIFMPLAEPDDMALFHLMNTMAKQERTRRPEVYDQVVFYRKRMTRLKLADSVDIGAGLHDISATGDTPKLRYGMKQVLGKDGLPMGVDRERARKALDYRTILPTLPKANLMNEIVICYRQHAGPRFPLFTKWISEEKAFVCFEEETSSQWILDGRIPDDWTQVRERLPN